MATQDEYRAKAKDALDKLQAQIDELRVQANLAGAEARDRFEKAIDALKKRQAEAKVRLDRATEKGGALTGGAWKNAANQMEEAIDGIGEAFSSLADEIDANLQAAGKAAKAGHKALLKEWKKQRTQREKLIDSA
jgi:hypothetical protein